MKEALNIKGHLTAVLTKPDGSVIRVDKDNMIVDGGFDFICDVIGNPSQPTEMAYIAVGTNNTAAAATQTALLAEVDRNAAIYSHTAGTKSFTLTATFNPGEATAGLQEAGIFNAPSLGTMLNRVTFPIINKDAADTLTVTFTITLS
jgi:hypothetical protein